MGFYAKDKTRYRFWRLMLPVLALLSSMLRAEMATLADNELSEVTGQALFMSTKQTNVNGLGTTHTFYRMGFDAQLELNTNIAELKLGETSTGTDVWMKNLALGCVANSAGTCVDSTSGTGTQLKNFTMLRPYVQLAFKNDGSRTSREVVGFRMGAENVSGPMSIGQLLSFSGYMNATGNITMQAQNDVAVTCGPEAGATGCKGNSQVSGAPNCCATGNIGDYWLYAPTANGANSYGYNAPLNALGLKDDFVCTGTFIAPCVAFSRTAVNYGSISRNNLPILAQGRRTTQAFIANANLATVVDDVTNTLSLSQPGGVAWLSPILIPIVKSSMRATMKASLAGSLGIPLGTDAQNHTNLNNYQIPYNLANVHSLNVNSSLFGISFQKENVRYPGYAADMQKGWGMYLPDAFTLNISQPLTNFVYGISTGAAREGNIVALTAAQGGAVFDNCWGTPQFC